MNQSTRSPVPALTMVCLVFAALSIVGITWGLPSRDIDEYLFGGADPWPGEKIYRLAGAGEKFSPTRAADVDVDPLALTNHEPVLLTGTDEDIARIYLRYRLYTHQPDEMITMMALAGMRPGKLELDPRLYQYGGLFIYPVGALIRLCGWIGWIDVRSDVAFYLDHPEEFGKFYVVARVYAAAWGLVGVLVVFAIARRLAGARAGLTAALLFTLMPVVICMAHEGKPHLPGAVLMVLAVFFAMRHLDSRAAGFSPREAIRAGGFSPREAAVLDGAPSPTPVPGNRESLHNWWMMCVCCGAAFGMVLSSLPIFVLIPLVAWLAERSRHSPTEGNGKDTAPASCGKVVVIRTVAGLAVATIVYLVTNPYIMINAFTNREVLHSNFGNSLAMYEIARIPEGLARVLELTVEGATLIVVGLGIVAIVFGAAQGNRRLIPLAVPAFVFFVQFVAIGAGKPAEYGRFGVFTNTALAIAVATLFQGARTAKEHHLQRAAILLLALLVGGHGAGYLWNFRADSGRDNTRTRLARDIAHGQGTRDQQRSAVAVTAEPAPYGCPPLEFARLDVFLFRPPSLDAGGGWNRDVALIRAVDLLDPAADPPALRAPAADLGWPGPTPISWANKPFEIVGPLAGAPAAAHR